MFPPPPPGYAGGPTVKRPNRKYYKIRPRRKLLAVGDRSRFLETLDYVQQIENMKYVELMPDHKIAMKLGMSEERYRQYLGIVYENAEGRVKHSFSDATNFANALILGALDRIRILRAQIENVKEDSGSLDHPVSESAKARAIQALLSEERANWAFVADELHKVGLIKTAPIKIEGQITLEKILQVAEAQQAADPKSLDEVKTQDPWTEFQGKAMDVAAQTPTQERPTDGTA